MSVNGLHRNRVRDRVSGRVRVSVRVRVRACRPDSSGNLLTRRKMEFAQESIVKVSESECWELGTGRRSELHGIAERP